MYQYLIDHAIQNVWCNNDQDNQLIFRLHKITKDVGVLNNFIYLNRRINLPIAGKRYHVFNIGQVHPLILGLLPRQPDWIVEEWMTFAYAINNLKLFCNLYTAKGIELPRYKSYYMFSNEKDLIVAIEQDNNFPVDFYNDDIYLRLYSNAFYQSLRADLSEEYLYCHGTKVISQTDILDLQSLYNTYVSKPGYTYVYKNGMLIDKVDLLNIVPGDIVELLYDSSVKRVVTFTVGNLLTFNSELDSKIKYLLHHLEGDNDTIDYQDDIDIHILYYTSNDRYKGYYYHRNNVDSHRMVTHRDYSIVVDYFVYIANQLNDRISDSPLDKREMKVQVKIREAGYYRPLIFDNNRIFELYKLNNSKQLQAMVGVNATVPEWQASNLENSAYTRIMRSKLTDIDLSLIQQGYGYNSISTIVGSTPSKTTLSSNRQMAIMPYILTNNCTVYEYDSSGTLLGYYHHLTGDEYLSTNDNCRLIEAISGYGTYQPDVRFGIDNIDLPDYDNYRVYMCYLVNGLPNEQWRDITGSQLYEIINNKLVWNNLETDQYLMVRTDSTFLAYDLNFASVGGNIYFTLSELEERFSEVDNYTLPVPLGELDIFLNGKSLIRGLDYIVKFPEVYIVNKKYLIQPAGSSTQHIHVRFTGFCKEDLSLDEIEEYGFIEHGFLSNNNRYDIRDDKVLRITVDGNLKHRDDLLFSELHDGISITDVNNGKPYQIKDIVVPLKQLVNENTYSLRDKSIQIDKRISDYMTIKLPQPSRNAISAIPELYPVRSPFLSRIIEDLSNDIIFDALLDRNMSDNDVLLMCKPYEYLLDFDPIKDTNRPNLDYVIIHPHHLNNAIELSLFKYRFLLRVIKLYCDGLVDISSFITFSS